VCAPIGPLSNVEGMGRSESACSKPGILTNFPPACLGALPAVILPPPGQPRAIPWAGSPECCPFCVRDEHRLQGSPAAHPGWHIATGREASHRSFPCGPGRREPVPLPSFHRAQFSRGILAAIFSLFIGLAASVHPHQSPSRLAESSIRSKPCCQEILSCAPASWG
jgi:hypothetical protein